MTFAREHRGLGVLHNLSLLLIATLLIAGCGAVRARSSIGEAEEAISRAEAIRAERVAPYEFAFAVEHLRKAREEAARAEHDDAARHAEVASDYAARAIAANEAAAADVGDAVEERSDDAN